MKAAHPKSMSSLCSWCGQHSSSSLQAGLQLPRPALCTSQSKTLLQQLPPDHPALPWPLSRLVPCHPSGLSAPRRVRGARQPCSIFRLWRIPLGSPFRAEKVSHCEGEAKTHIRPTDPALTRSKLAGLLRFGGREVAAGAHGDAARAASRSETQRCALLAGLGCTPPVPGRRAALQVCLSHHC